MKRDVKREWQMAMSASSQTLASSKMVKRKMSIETKNRKRRARARARRQEENDDLFDYLAERWDYIRELNKKWAADAAVQAQEKQKRYITSIYNGLQNYFKSPLFVNNKNCGVGSVPDEVDPGE